MFVNKSEICFGEMTGWAAERRPVSTDGIVVMQSKKFKWIVIRFRPFCVHLHIAYANFDFNAMISI